MLRLQECGRGFLYPCLKFKRLPYDAHDIDKKFTYVITPEAIHDRVRRYIYDPVEIINSIKISEGNTIKCKTCGGIIDTIKMKVTFDKNFCPYCGGKLY